MRPNKSTIHFSRESSSLYWVGEELGPKSLRKCTLILIAKTNDTDSKDLQNYKYAIDHFTFLRSSENTEPVRWISKLLSSKLPPLAMLSV